MFGLQSSQDRYHVTKQREEDLVCIIRIVFQAKGAVCPWPQNGDGHDALIDRRKVRAARGQ